MGTSKGMAGRIGTGATVAAAALGLALWVSAPIASFLWLTDDARGQQLEVEKTVWTPLVASTTGATQSAGIAMSWAPPPQLLAPAWSGVVQRVLVQPGTPVVSGTELFQIDGVTRIAYSSPIPFSRSLAEKDKGEDVEYLNDLLRSQGLRAPSGGTYTAQTSASVAKLAEKLGVGATEGIGFDPSWVVYLPQPLTVSSVSLTVGAPALAQGEPILVGQDSLVGAVVIADGYRETLDAQEGPVGPVAEEDRIVVDATDELSVGSTTLRRSESGSDIAPEDLGTLQGLVAANAKTVPAKILTPPEAGQWSVPPAAIITGESGALCVVSRDSGTVSSIPVTVVGQDGTNSLVTGDLSAGSDVGLAPAAGDRSCE